MLWIHAWSTCPDVTMWTRQQQLRAAEAEQLVHLCPYKAVQLKSITFQPIISLLFACLLSSCGWSGKYMGELLIQDSLHLQLSKMAQRLASQGKALRGAAAPGVTWLPTEGTMAARTVCAKISKGAHLYSFQC